MSNIKHNKSSSRIYNIHKFMKQRCLNPNAPNYKDYGGRGITICDEWLDFNNFYADMGDPPRDCTLDRINNNLGYNPDNCRWATQEEQSFNKRLQRRNKSGHKGIRWREKRGKWEAYISIQGKHKHVGSFDTLEEAIVARQQALDQHYPSL